jgi:hypothetical protein
MTMQEYFDKTVEKVLISNGMNVNDIPIIIFDHEKFNGKSKDALGTCHCINGDDAFIITIDEFFINECYKYFILDTFSTWELNAETLEYVICHELAHTTQWRHCKKHEKITQKLLSKVSLPKKYYTYLKRRA